jgi:hypothetical protein
MPDEDIQRRLRLPRHEGSAARNAEASPRLRMRLKMAVATPVCSALKSPKVVTESGTKLSVMETPRIKDILERGHPERQKREADVVEAATALSFQIGRILREHGDHPRSHADRPASAS